MAERVTDRETLIEEANALVSEGGESRLTIRALASACHISPSTVYNYFPSRDALVQELSMQYVADIDRSTQSPDESVRANAGWIEFLAWATQNRHQAELILNRFTQPDRAAWASLFKSTFRQVDPGEEPDRARFVASITDLVLADAEDGESAAGVEARLTGWLAQIRRWVGDS